MTLVLIKIVKLDNFYVEENFSTECFIHTPQSESFLRFLEISLSSNFRSKYLRIRVS